MAIEMVRVDDRLVHGQITLKWTRTIGANMIMVANDAAAKDPMRKSLMKMAAPSGVHLEVLPVDEAATQLQSNKWQNRKILVLVHNPVDLLQLVEAGAPIEHVNVGNAGGGKGKVRLTKQIHADPAEVEAWKELDQKGIDLEQQWLPGESKTDLNPIIKNLD